MADNLILNFYAQLRNATCSDASVVSSKLEEIYKNKESIFILIRFIENQEDCILKQYAIYGIRRYLNIHGKIIPEEIFDSIECLIISSLSYETVETTRAAFISLIETIVTINGGLRDTLERYIFSGDDKNNGTVVQILNGILSVLNNDYINSNADKFLVLIKNGISSESPSEMVQLVQLLCKLTCKINNNMFYKEFKGQLLVVFKNILEMQDSDLIISFLSPITDACENGFKLLPFDCLKLIIKILTAKEYPLYLKLRINMFFSSFICSTHKNLQTDFVINLIELEFQLVTQFYEFNAEDQNFLWTFECQNLIEKLIKIIPEENVLEFVVTKFQMFYQSNNPEEKFALLFILACSVNGLTSTFENYFPDIFSYFVISLQSPILYIRNYASTCIELNAQNFADIITDNLTSLVDAIIDFISNSNVYFGIYLLNSVISACFDSDPVFEKVFYFVFKYLRCSDSYAASSSMNVINSLIRNSHSYLDNFVDDIFKVLSSLIIETSFSQPELFEVLNSLILRANKKMNQYLPDFIELVNSALQIDDNVIRYYAINALIKNKIFKNETANQIILNKLVKKLYDIANEDHDPENLTNGIVACSGAALNALTYICISMNLNDALPSLLNLIVKQLSYPLSLPIPFISNSICLIQKKISFLTKENPNYELNTDQIAKIMMTKLDNFMEYTESEFTYIIKSITSLIKYTKNSYILNQKFNILKIIIFSINCFILDNKEINSRYIEWVFRILSMIVKNSEDDSQEFIQQLIGLLNKCMNLRLYQLKSFAIKFYAELILINKIQPEQEKEVINYVVPLLKNESTEISQLSVCFIYTLFQSDNDNQIMDEKANDIFQMLIERLKEINYLSTSNKILIEWIIGAISTIVPKIIGENFPYTEVLDLTLPHLPITKLYFLNEQVYKFIIQLIRFATPDYEKEFLRIFIDIFARTKCQLDLLLIDKITLASIAKQTSRLLQKYENPDIIISTILNDDPYRINCFNVLYGLFLEKANYLFSPLRYIQMANE